MSLATKRHVSLALVAAFALLTSASSGAQSIHDYSQAQRALLEAEMAKSTAKAMGGTGAAQTPVPTTPTDPVQSVPFAARERGMSIVGVIALTSRSMVELVNDGETHLLLQGDTVPNTSWIVQTITPERVVLKTGRPSRTRTLAVPSEGR